MGLLLAARALHVLREGVPALGLVHGSSPEMTSTCALALGFFLFDTLHTLNLYVTFEVIEETLLVHHVLGLVLYAVTLTSGSYLYIATIVLVQARLFVCMFVFGGVWVDSCYGLWWRRYRSLTSATPRRKLLCDSLPHRS